LPRKIAGCQPSDRPGSIHRKTRPAAAAHPLLAGQNQSAKLSLFRVDVPAAAPSDPPDLLPVIEPSSHTDTDTDNLPRQSKTCQNIPNMNRFFAFPQCLCGFRQIKRTKFIS
jgi:hypothetical protein